MLPMSRGKQQLSSMAHHRPIRARPSPYPAVPPKAPVPPVTPTPSAPPALQPPESRVTYVLSPSVPGVLLVPATAFKLDQHGQWTLGQGVIQLFQSPAVLVPSPKPLPVVVSNVKPGPLSTQKTDVPVPAAVTQLSAPSSTAMKSALPQVVPGPTAPTVSAQTSPWPSLKTHLQQTALKGRLAERQPYAAEDSETDDGKMLALARYRKNHLLMKMVLSASVVRPSEGGRTQQLTSKINVFERRLKDLEDEAKSMEVCFDQKVKGIRAAASLFQYKLNRFQQLAALINRREFQQAVLEAEMENLQGFTSVRPRQRETA